MAINPSATPRKQPMFTQAVMEPSLHYSGWLFPPPPPRRGHRNAQKLSGEGVEKLYIGVVNVEWQELLSPRDEVRNIDEPIKIIRSDSLVPWFDIICGMTIHILVLIDIWLCLEHYRMRVLEQFTRRFFKKQFLCYFFSINMTATTVYFCG